MDRLTSETAALEKKIAAATEQVDLTRQARDVASRDVLRLEAPGRLGNKGGPEAAVLGLVAGLMLSVWWWTRPFSNDLPLLAAGVPFGLSALVLLRGAWRAGRVAGARGPS